MLSTAAATLLASLLPLPLLPSPVRAAADLVKAEVKPDQVPKQAEYDPTDEKLRDAASLLQQALNANDVKVEEELFSRVIDEYKDTEAVWVPDVVGRALGNRGNARSRQGKLDDAIADYNAAIQLCPWSVDPILNRGVVLEAQGRFDEAVADYRTVLAAEPEDPSAWNNLGNASAGLQRWGDAAEFYGKAATLSPAFSFAAANKALATYQLGEKDPKNTDEALREMRNLLRRYPDFPDVRAALAAALWEKGEGGEAESNWLRVEDPRYRDRAWLASTRRWPPRLVASLVAFLDVQSSPKSYPSS